MRAKRVELGLVLLACVALVGWALPNTAVASLTASTILFEDAFVGPAGQPLEAHDGA